MSTPSSNGLLLKGGVDTLLTRQGRQLQVGEEVRFVLIKGPARPPHGDPVNRKAPPESFPLIAKFPESVVKPNFAAAPWKTARLFQQDAPKAQEDSDEEVDSNSNKPKRRWRPLQAPKREWILQEQVEFLQSMMAKRQRKTTTTDEDPSNNNNNNTNSTLSTKYVGKPEHNPSQYALVAVLPNTDTTASSSSLQLTLLPKPQASIQFSQPNARNTLTLSQAEQAIEAQQGGVRVKFHMNTSSHKLNSNHNNSRQRLLGKLNSRQQRDDDDDDDNVMGDVTFRNRKGGGKSRQELLQSVGDASLKVDADGVLGGAHDGEFGRGQRFGQFQAAAAAATTTTNKNSKTATSDDDNDTKGNDGLAMADDFYQRDVQAEYEELDYDANEQFDDDDVDVGETEVVQETGGYAEEEEEELDEDELMGDKPSGAEGLASLAGFRLMLAKARGEITPEQAAEQAEGAKAKEEALAKRAAEMEKKNDDEPQDHLAQIMAAAEKSREEAEKKKKETEASVTKKSSTTTLTNQVDEHGQRIISIEAVRREIWLHHGKMPMKRLMKIFDIKKKSTQDRQNKFRDAVKELCTMETDPLGGRMLVLKQHYANMG